MTTFTIPVAKANKSFSVDFDALPEIVQRHIIEYGLKQKFNDCHSAEKDGEKAWGLTQNLLERLQAGELSKGRTSGSPVEREMTAILVAVIRAKIGGKVVELKAMSVEALVSLLSKTLKKSAETVYNHFETLAKANIAKRAEETALILSDIIDIEGGED